MFSTYFPVTKHSNVTSLSRFKLTRLLFGASMTVANISDELGLARNIMCLTKL